MNAISLVCGLWNMWICFPTMSICMHLECHVSTSSFFQNLRIHLKLHEPITSLIKMPIHCIRQTLHCNSDITTSFNKCDTGTLMSSQWYGYILPIKPYLYSALKMTRLWTMSLTWSKTSTRTKGLNMTVIKDATRDIPITHVTETEHNIYLHACLISPLPVLRCSHISHLLAFLFPSNISLVYYMVHLHLSIRIHAMLYIVRLHLSIRMHAMFYKYVYITQSVDISNLAPFKLTTRSFLV